MELNKKERIDDYVEQIYHVKCKGRDNKAREILKDEILIEINIYKRPKSDIISSLVECKHNIGSHGDKCGIIHNYLTRGVCPYVFDIPYAIDNKYNGGDL